MQEQAKIWFEAREVIIEFLAEIDQLSRPRLTREQLEHNAAALIARLAAKKLLICTPDEIKD